MRGCGYRVLDEELGACVAAGGAMMDTILLVIASGVASRWASYGCVVDVEGGDPALYGR